MSAAHSYAMKMLLKTFGLNFDELEEKAKLAQSLVMEFNLDELRTALQTMLDYRENQAQNELRLKAIMNQLGVIDPVLQSEKE
jgi:hypothetical protein